MEIVENISEPQNAQVARAHEDACAPSEFAQSGHLLRILGVGFGIAVGIGGTIGVGILRNPSGVAAQLGSFWMIMLAWSLGGLYCMLGALTRRAIRSAVAFLPCRKLSTTCNPREKVSCLQRKESTQ